MVSCFLATNDIQKILFLYFFQHHVGRKIILQTMRRTRLWNIIRNVCQLATSPIYCSAPRSAYGFFKRQYQPIPKKEHRKSYKISNKSKIILNRRAKRKGEEFSSELRDALKLNISVRRFQHILSSFLDLKYIKVTCAPFIKPIYRKYFTENTPIYIQRELFLDICRLF